jgi:hypothetical protein
VRIFLATLAIAILAGTAIAQDAGMGGGRKGHGGAAQNAGQQQADQQKKKAVDDAYKSAITRIPEPKEKYDPWKTAR